MTDLELSRKLALAIGYREHHAQDHGTNALWVLRNSNWKMFDYRDWNVIGPIAQRYDCFPLRTDTQGWWAGVFGCCGLYADTPQRAIALAVIQGAGK